MALPRGALRGLASVSGDVVTEGQSTSMDIPFENLFDHVEGGFQLYAEARYRRIFVAFDGTWATLRGEGSGSAWNLDAKTDQQLYDLRVGYELLRTCSPAKQCEGWEDEELVVDAYVGARYYHTEITLTFTGPPGRPRDASGVAERVDPFLGARVGWAFSSRWVAGIRADVGGFGIGDAAEFTWQASATLGWRLSRSATLLLGWRVLASDTVQGSGAERAGQDLVQNGPIVGAGFNF